MFSKKYFQRNIVRQSKHLYISICHICGMVKIQDVIFVSSNIIQFIISKCAEWGLPFKAWQISAFLVIVCIIALFAIIKYVVKALFKWGWVIIIIWFLLGFFAPS